MSQVEVNTNFNSVNVENTINTIDVNQDFGNILVVPQQITSVVEVITPGPQGAKGDPGDPSLFTSSFVTTASFYAFTASYNTASFTGSFTGNGSGLVGVISSSYALTASYAGNVPETASFAISASQAQNANNAISSSYALTASYASNVPVTASYAISASQAQNAVSASYAVNSDTSSFQTNIQFAESHIPFFDSNNSMSSSAMRQWMSESIVINAEFGTGANPEALFVFQPSTESINIITAEADVDNYTQLNVFNRNSGSTASADIVATADNGNEFTNFVNMGINSSTFTGSVGGPNDAYLYSTGNDLTIGNASANKHVRFFTGGGLVDNYQKLVLNPDNLHEMTGSLDIEGSLNVTDTITGSLFGTASYAVTASYASNVPATASFAVSASYAATASYADNFTVAGTLTAQTINVQTVTSSVIYSSGSNVFGNDLNNTQVFTGSVTITGSLAVNDSSVILTNQTSSMTVLSASYATTASFAENIHPSITASYAISASQAVNSDTSSFQTNIQFAQNFIPFFNSNNSMSSSAMRQWLSESIVINADFGTGANPEALFIFQPNTESINIVTAEADVDNYIQVNVFNRNSGSTASSDIVATADNGDEFVNFIDMGINSSTFTGSIGAPNDAYIYSTGNDLTIGNASANKHIRFFTGGGLVDAYQKLVLNPDNLHEMTGSLDIEGSLNVTGTITGSLFGTASYAITASYASNVPDTASFAVSASYANNATSASYALTSTSASFAVNATTASYVLNAVSASFATTASYSITANSSSYAVTASFIDGGFY